MKIRAEKTLETRTFKRPFSFRHEPSSANPFRNNCPGKSGRRIDDWEKLLFNLDSLGTVHAETRNRDAVFQFTGRYGEFATAPGGNTSRDRQNARQLRFFLDNWHHGFTIQGPGYGNGAYSALHLFDFQGMLVHTIRPTVETNRGAFECLANCLAQAINPNPKINHRARVAKKPRYRRPTDSKEFRNRWFAVTNEPERLGLLNRYRISELQGLRLIGDTWANQVPIGAIHERLRLLLQTELPCTLELSNTGAQQIRSGKLERMNLESEQLVLSGPDWNLSVRMSEISSAWLVTKPEQGRLESSIALYNRCGQAVVRIYGAAKSLENAIWQDLLGTLPTMA